MWHLSEDLFEEGHQREVQFKINRLNVKRIPTSYFNKRLISFAVSL